MENGRRNHGCDWENKAVGGRPSRTHVASTSWIAVVTNKEKKIKEKGNRDSRGRHTKGSDWGEIEVVADEEGETALLVVHMVMKRRHEQRWGAAHGWRQGREEEENKTERGKGGTSCGTMGRGKNQMNILS